MSEAREQVEKTADRIRDELVVTLRELDRRRSQVTDLRYQIDRHREGLIWLAAGVGAVALVIVGSAAYRTHWKREHLTKYRWKAMRRAWQHPERLASKSQDKPLPLEISKKLLVAFATALGAQAARRLSETAIPPKPRKIEYPS